MQNRTIWILIFIFCVVAPVTASGIIHHIITFLEDTWRGLNLH